MLESTEQANLVKATSAPKLPWVEPLKAIALFWIFLNHVGERLFGSPYFGNPDSHWPPLAERVSQFLSVPPRGGFLLAAFRNIAWIGDQGVTIFLIISGLTLTWSCLAAGNSATLSWAGFYKRRLMRVYPLWIAANLIFLFPFAILAVHLTLLDPRLYLSLIGIRVMPDQLYYGNSAWWFVTLLLQLYLVFPLLWNLLRRMGPLAYGILVPALALAIRGAGLFVFQGYLDAWARGAIFITRLPEFALGMSLGIVLFEFSKQARPLPSRAKLIAPAVMILLLGLAASFTLLGMTVAPVLIGCGAMVIFYCLFSANLAITDWIGQHSLSLFLVHQPFVRLLIPASSPTLKLLPALMRVTMVVLCSVLAAVLLERITNAVLAALKRGARRWGTLAFAARLAAAFVFIWCLLIAGDLLVRRLAPLEAADLGWGERPSLQPDSEFGWKLRPLEQVRLRWITYDYEVHSNSLGFPGAEYPPGSQPGVRRILVTGDAFTSAEGVDTDNSWPRLLEKKMNSIPGGPRTQVMNFGITGYGPNQYQKVVDHFAPIYHPNLIVIGLFINDYEDAITSTADFQKSIGFGRPDPNGLASVLAFRQLTASVRAKLIFWIYRYALRKPDPDGYFLGQFDQLEAGPDGNVAKGRSVLAGKLQEIKKSADMVGARLLVVLIPSGPQVCGPQSLAYWPKYTNLADPYFDVTLPQRTSKQITGALGVETIDLLPSLRAMNNCPYQTHNMHWTIAAHQMAAEEIARFLMRDNTRSN